MWKFYALLRHFFIVHGILKAVWPLCYVTRFSVFRCFYIGTYNIITILCVVVVLDDPFCETYFAASSLLQRLYFYLSIVIKELCFSQINAWTIAKCCLIKCYLRPCFLCASTSRISTTLRRVFLPILLTLNCCGEC